MTASRHPTARAARGFALLIVLWSVVLLAVLGGSYLAAMRTEARVARNMLAAVQARLLCEAAFNRAILALHHPVAAHRPVADGSVHTLPVADAQVRFSVLDETARIDLNKAPGDVLAGIVAGADVGASAGPNVDPAAGAGLADVILDWRDGDALRRPHGAEDADYRAAALPYGAKDAPFDSVEELLLLPGMTHEVYARLARSVTVHSGQARIDPTLASARVLAALPGVGPIQAAAYVATRDALREAGQLPPPPQFVDRRYVTNGSGDIYTITASANLDRGGAAAVEATVRVQRERRDQPIVILRWKEIDSDRSHAGFIDAEAQR